MKPLAVFTPSGTVPDQQALEQIHACLADDRAVAGALCADHHVGYSMPIGGVVAYDNAVSPSGVGYDIGCGNMAVETHILYDDVKADVPGLATEINRRISFGKGRSNPEPVEHPLFDDDAWEEVRRIFGASLKQVAEAQLGTVGGGNHYVDLLVDETGVLWAANHFGSRKLGHTIAKGFLNLADGLPADGKARDRDEPTVLSLGTELGASYLECMKLAGSYAYAGREHVMGEVLDLLGASTIQQTVHNHHNYAWLEDRQWVVRKGATPLTGQPAFIGGSMADISVIVRGTGDEIGTIGSAPHGAGRVMSRTKAAGKVKRSTVYECTQRDCSYRVPAKVFAASKETVSCPDHPGGRFRRLQLKERKTVGVIDWPAALQRLDDQGVTLVGADAEEAPDVYKDLAAVIAAHPNIVILHTLRPVAVIMAGSDVPADD